MKDLRIKREDGKIFEVAKEHNGYRIIENRGTSGRFDAREKNILWSSIEPFESMIQAYAWLMKNVNNLL